MTPKMPARTPLNRERVLQAAVDLADRSGLDALTMRRLGSELGVEAMSLYKHVANKDEILDGILELVIAEIDVPDSGTEWKQAMRRRAESARAVLVQHSWAVGLLEARGSTDPAALRYIDAIIGILRAAGFSLRNAAHAFSLLDSYIYGHVIQEVNLTKGDPDEAETPAKVDSSATDPLAPHEYPHLRELQQEAMNSPHSFDEEFAFGLNLIIDALDSTISDLPA